MLLSLKTEYPIRRFSRGSSLGSPIIVTSHLKVSANSNKNTTFTYLIVRTGSILKL